MAQSKVIGAARVREGARVVSAVQIVDRERSSRSLLSIAANRRENARGRWTSAITRAQVLATSRCSLLERYFGKPSFRIRSNRTAIRLVCDGRVVRSAVSLSV